MSALRPSGTVATCSPVEAFWMRNVRSEAGLTHWLPMKKLLRSRLISFSRESRASAGVGKFVIVDVGDADSGLGQRMDAGIDHRRRPAHIALRVGSETLERLADIGGDEAVSIFDRKRVVWGKGVSVRVDLGGRRIIKKKNTQ